MRTFSSIGVAVVIGILFPVAIVLLQIQRTVLSPLWMVDFLREQNVYARVLENGLNALPLANVTENFPLFDEASAREVLQKSVRPDELQNIAEGVLREAYGLLKTPGKNIQDVAYEINLTQIVTRIADEASGAIKNRMSALPKCSAEQLRRLSEAQEGIFECAPQGFNASIFQEGIDQAVQQVTNIVPPKISVRSIVLGEGIFARNEPLSKDQLDEINKKIYMMQRGYALLGIMTVLSFGALFILTIFLAFLKRPLHSSLKWLGLTCVFSALPLFLVSVFERVTQFSMIPFPTGDLPQEVASLITDTFTAFAVSFADGIIFTSGLTIATGIACALTGVFLPTRPALPKKITMRELNRKI